MAGRYPDSKVEIAGFEARHYDLLVNLATLGGYSKLLKRAIRLMNIRSSDRIVDFGSGTGKNAVEMLRYLSSEGVVLGIDISDEMIEQFRKRCSRYSNAKVISKRIDEPLDLGESFDKVFISFVLHGFPIEAQRVIVQNAWNALRSGGSFFILDYNEFDIDRMPFFLRIPMRAIECRYAFEFIKLDLKGFLSDAGFGQFREHEFFYGYTRLLEAVKS